GQFEGWVLSERQRLKEGLLAALARLAAHLGKTSFHRVLLLLLGVAASATMAAGRSRQDHSMAQPKRNPDSEIGWCPIENSHGWSARRFPRQASSSPVAWCPK